MLGMAAAGTVVKAVDFAAVAAAHSQGLERAAGQHRGSLQELAEVFVVDSRLDTAAEVFDLDP